MVNCLLSTVFSPRTGLVSISFSRSKCWFSCKKYLKTITHFNFSHISAGNNTIEVVSRDAIFLKSSC
jgi:hypothetical protein